MSVTGAGAVPPGPGKLQDASTNMSRINSLYEARMVTQSYSKFASLSSLKRQVLNGNGYFKDRAFPEKLYVIIGIRNIPIKDESH
jgi:hypothetical protein